MNNNISYNSTNIYNLEPRTISLNIKLQVLFKHVVMFIGLSFTIMSLIMFIIFGMQVSFSEFKFSEKSPFVNGQITNVLGTNSYENKVRVFKYDFKYSINSKQYSGTSFTTGQKFEVGQVVNIQYVENEPQVSRIENTRNGAFSPLMLIFFLPFIFVGGSMVGIRIYLGLKSIKLLRYGQIAYGVLIDKQPTNTKINNQTVYKLSFEFQAIDGTKYTTIAKSHLTRLLEDETQEKLVYDANNPKNAVMIDSLPIVVKQYFYNL